MADVDEDIIPGSGPPPEEIDLSDETQDFRFLAALSSEDAKIPKRGEKDFEPHSTALQSNTLAASRQAMHNALSFQRIHLPKGYTYATYHPESNMAYTYNPKGILFTKMGQILPASEDPLAADGLRGQRMWLLPEEVMYLLERGSLDVRWPASKEDSDVRGLPMSLQGAYAMFIGDEGSHNGVLTFERYSVYASLKRIGYTVQRAPSWNSPGPPLNAQTYPQRPGRTWQAGLFNITTWLSKLLARKCLDANVEVQKLGPMVVPGLYRNYAEIYRRLALIDWYDPTTHDQPPQDMAPSTDPAFRVTYHVWKPGSGNFKKTAPGPPDFRIAVVDGRETTVPTLQQLTDLFNTLPYDPPRPDGQLYQKLKNGHKNVILAIVDQGVVSYLRMTDAAFSREKLYEQTGRAPGGKRGGKGGGRGRGR